MNNENRKITIILIIICLIILLPHLFLLAATSWGNDGYYVAQLYQSEGWQGFFQRIFTWSPRFFSEIILYLYYNTVPLLQRPFTWVMLFINWLFLIGSIFVFTQTIINKNSLFSQNRKEHLSESKNKRKEKYIYLKTLLPSLIALLVFIYFLKAAHASQMYFLWIVSVAYIPTLVGVIFNSNFLINQADSSRISQVNIFQYIIFGVITSSSWEMGTIYQLLFSSCLFLFLLLPSFLPRLSHLPFARLDKLNRVKLFIANLIPFALSLYILFLLQLSRLTAVEDSSLTSSQAHNLNTSFIASMFQFLKEIFFVPEKSISFNSFFYSMIYKLGLLLLLTILFCQIKIRLNKITRNACLVSIVLLFITKFVIIFSSYYQLGIASTNRQTSFKAALLGLIIVITSLILSSLLSSQKNLIYLGKININSLLNSRRTLLVSFGLTFTLLMNLNFNSLLGDLLNYKNIIVSNNQNWQRNREPSQSLAVYVQVPSDYIFTMQLPTGLYPDCDDPDNGRTLRYMNYFNKQKLYVTNFPNRAFTDEELDRQMARAAEEIKSRQEKIDFTCFLSLGHVETVNQHRDLDKIVEVSIDKTVEIAGWVMNYDKTSPERIVITLDNDETLLVNHPLDFPRPDLVEYFSNTAFLNSGWKTSLLPNPQWEGKTITFKVWAYDPETKTANFSDDFTLKFSALD